MKKYSKAIIEHYIKCNYEKIFNTYPKSVYIASVPNSKPISEDNFKIQIGIKEKNNFSVRSFLPPLLISKEESEKHGIRNGTELVPSEPEIKYTTDFVFQNCRITQKKIRPISAGCQISNLIGKSTGTLGAVFQLKFNDEINDNKKFIITSCHVLVDHYFDLKTKGLPHDSLVFQPYRFLNGKLDYNNVIGLLKYGQFDDQIDAAIVELIIDKYDVSGGNIWNNKPIIDIDIPKIGEKLILYGAKSGIKENSIISDYCYVKVKDESNGNEYLFKKQILLNPISEQGDSGGILIDKNNMAIGLLMAGNSDYSIANKLNQIFSKKTNYYDGDGKNQKLTFNNFLK